MASRLPRMPGGVLIPSRLTWETLSEELSDYTEEGPRPGVAEPIDEGTLYRVQVSGGQGEDLEVRATSPGYPGSLAVAYRRPEQGETSDDDWRGWAPPVWWDAWQGAHMGSPSVSFRRHDIVTLPTSQEAVLIRRGSNGVCGARRIDPATLELQGVGEQLLLSGAVGWQWPCAAVVPDDRAEGGGRIVLSWGGRIYASADAGATWQLQSRWPYGSQSLATWGHARMAYHAGQLVLLVQDTGTADQVHQWLSTDEGATWTHVTTVDDVGDSLQLAAHGGGITVVYRRGHGVYSRTLWSAGHALDQAPEVEVLDFLGTLDHLEGGLALAADADGTLWCLRVPDKGDLYEDLVLQLYSTDGGQSWAVARGVPLMRDGGSRPRDLSATWAAGRMHVAHSWVDGASGLAAGLAVLTLGGWSSWTTGPPAGGSGQDYGDRAGSCGWWDLDPQIPQARGLAYMPVAHPGDEGWTVGASYAGVLSNGWLQLTTSLSAEPVSRSHAQWLGAIVVQCEVSVVQGGGHGVPLFPCGLLVSADDSSARYTVGISLATTGIEVRDQAAGTTLETVALDLTEPVQLQVEVTEAGLATVGYRRRGDTRWTLLVDGEPLTAGLTAGAGAVRWGHPSIGTARSRWRWVTVISRYIGDVHPRLYHGEEVYGRVLTAAPTPIPDAADDEGRVPWLRAVTGPARHGERLLLPVAYDYGVHHLFPSISPSPSRQWRGAAGTTQRIAWDLGRASWLGDALGVYVRGRISTVRLECSDDGISWDEVGLGSAHVAAGTTQLALTGDVAELSSVDPPGRYVWEGELVGGWLTWTRVFPSPKSGHHDIVGNSAGTLDHTASVQPVLRLDPDSLDGTEPSTILSPIYAPQALLVVYPPARLRRRYWRVSLSSVPHGVRVGVLAAGRIVPWGAEVDPGADTYATSTTESRSAYGVSRVRERGPPTRTWSLSWGGGVHRGRLRSGDPDYLGVAGGLPLTAGEDVGELVAGVLRETRSGQLPVVVIDRLPTSDATITDPTRMLYGRIRGAPSINDMGQDRASVLEWVRVEGITVEEIP